MLSMYRSIHRTDAERFKRSLMNFPKITICAVVAVLAILSTAAPTFGQADPETRPPTQDLLPETTVLFIQIDDFRDMASKMSEMSMGQFVQDEAIAPLLEGLWDEAKLAYEDVKEEVGLDIEDVQKLPAGEMTFAVISPRRKNPEFMLIVELDNEEASDAIDRVLDRGRQLIREEAGEEITTEESDDGIEYESFMVDDKKVKFFRKDGLLVGCTSEAELEAFVDRWMGREVEKVRPLSTNRKFVTIMNRCKGSNDLKPEGRFFVDPIAFAKSATRGNFGAQAAINFLPVLGLDGLLGIGGSMILTEEEFEYVYHGHLLLASPKKGLFEMVALKPTNYEPEPWLPADTIVYATTSWDVEKMLDEISKMVDMYMGSEDQVDEWIEGNINEVVGFDLKNDVIAHLSGRLTFLQMLEKPVRFNSQVPMLALGIKDNRAEQLEGALELIVDTINTEGGDGNGDEDQEDRLVASEYKGIQIYGIDSSRTAERMERQRERRIERGQPDIDISVPEPCFAIVGDSFLISFQSRKFLEHAIDVHQGESPALVDDPTYKAVAAKMTRLLKTDMPCMMSYNDPEDSMRFMFELAKGDSLQGILDSGAAENKYVAGIKGRLDDNPLPEFDEIKHYFMPSGSFATSDDTGYHFLTFGLRERPLAEDE